MVDLIAKPFSANTLLGRILPWLRPLEPHAPSATPALSLPTTEAVPRARAGTPQAAVSEPVPFEELLHLLDEGCLEAVELAQRHQPELALWLAQEQAQWTDALSHFDFMTAAALLRRRLADAKQLTEDTENA